MNFRTALLPACIALSLAADTSAPPIRLEAGKDPLAAPQFLPVDEAFAFSARLAGKRLIARWEMPPGYYLYRHRFHVEGGEGVLLGAVDIPPGKPIVDDYFGEAEVYYGEVELGAAVLRHAPNEVNASISYQGCANYGLCYPRQIRRVALAVTDAGGEPAAGGAEREDTPHRAPAAAPDVQREAAAALD